MAIAIFWSFNLNCGYFCSLAKHHGYIWSFPIKIWRPHYTISTASQIWKRNDHYNQVDNSQWDNNNVGSCSQYNSLKGRHGYDFQSPTHAAFLFINYYLIYKFILFRFISFSNMTFGYAAPGSNWAHVNLSLKITLS